MEAVVQKTSHVRGLVAPVLAFIVTLVIWRFGPFAPIEAVFLTIAVLFLFVLRRPVWAMGAFLVSHLTVNNYMVNVSSGFSISLRLLLLILIVLAVWFSLGRRQIKLGPKAKPIVIAATILIIVTIMANAVNYPSMSDVFKDFRQWIIGLMIVVLLPAVTRDIKDLKILLIIALVGASASAAIAIMQHYQVLDMQQYTLISGYNHRDYRMPGMAEDPLVLSFVLSSALPILAAIFLSGRTKVGARLLLAVSSMLIVLGIYFTYTRSAALGAGVGIVAMALLLGKRIRVPIILAVLVVGLAIVLVSQIHETRFITQADDSSASRDVLRQAGIAIALDHPIWGVGVFDFPRVSEQYSHAVSQEALLRSGEDLGHLQPHNDFIFLAACYGIPTLIVYIVLVVLVLLLLLNSHRITRIPFIKGFSIGLIGALIAYLVNAYYHNCLGSLPLFWVLVGFALSAAKLASMDKKIISDSDGLGTRYD